VIARSAASSMPAIGALQSTRDEAFQEGAPVDFGLRDRDRDAEHVVAAEGVDADGGRRGTVVGDGRCLFMSLIACSLRCGDSVQQIEGIPAAMLG